MLKTIYGHYISASKTFNKKLVRSVTYENEVKLKQEPG